MADGPGTTPDEGPPLGGDAKIGLHDSTLLPRAPRALEPADPSERHGDRFGRYRLLERIGEGSFGEVWKARRDDPDGLVAIKVLKSSIDREEVLARFEQERNAMALLDHPNVAKAIDAGLTDRGRPFFVMEYVPGLTITEYCDKRRLSINQRLHLFTQVCDAVGHVHTKGLVHRDLKPSNILVMEVRIAEDSDPQPVVKIIDFGVAKSITRRLAEATIDTQPGRVIGTLAYMAPEQAGSDRLDIDHRADIFALGVVLYELLAGEPPISRRLLESTALYAVYELMRSSVRRPASAAIEELGERAEPVAAVRGETASSLLRRLRMELEWIPARALYLEPARRYATAQQMGDDLRRYAAKEPLDPKTRPPSRIYVLRKAMQRYRWAVRAAGLGCILLILLVVFSMYASVSAAENSRLARMGSEASALALARANDAERASEREALAAADARRAMAQVKAELEAADIQRGRMATQAGDSRGARLYLWPAFLRNPNSAQARWALWEYFARFGFRAVAQAHTGLARRCVISSDGRTVYTSGLDGDVRSWDAQTLALVAQDLGDPATARLSLAISSDGSLIASSADPRVVRILRGRSLERVRVLRNGSAHPSALAFAPDGSHLYVGYDTGAVVVWETATWTKLREHTAHRNPVTSIEVSAQGWPIATSDVGGYIAIWDDMEQAPRTWHAHRDQIVSFAFASDNRLITTGGDDGVSHIWDAATMEELGRFSAPNGSILDMDFAPDGRNLLTSGWWGVITWDTVNWTILSSLSMPAGVYELAISPDGRVAYASLETGELRSWTLSHGPEALRLLGHVGRTVGTMNNEGTMIATGDSDGVLRLWSAVDGSLLRQTQAHIYRIRSIALHPTLPWVASCIPGQLSIRDIVTLEPAWPDIDVYCHSHSSFDFSPDGTMLAVFSANGRIVMFDCRTKQEVWDIAPNTNGEPISIRFAPDSHHIIVIHRGPSGQVLRTSDGARVATLDLENRMPMTCAFSADGAEMAMGNWGGELTVWSTTDWSRLNVLTGHGTVVYDVAFSPKGEGVLASASGDGTVRLWDARSGRSLLTLDRFGGWAAHSVAFDRTGSRLLSCNCFSGEVVVWDLHKYDADLARHVEQEIQRLSPELAGTLDLEPARTWARSVLEAVPSGEAPPTVRPLAP